eukprot:GHVT01007045.1.p1 GENE.GHVT01007045.1~~GHVT01007045.1.p1  ORF type:complete len:191 (+),score=27.31 GHVT01007045.1:124-696(+)
MTNIHFLLLLILLTLKLCKAEKLQADGTALDVPVRSSGRRPVMQAAGGDDAARDGPTGKAALLAPPAPPPQVVFATNMTRRNKELNSVALKEAEATHEKAVANVRKARIAKNVGTGVAIASACSAAGFCLLNIPSFMIAIPAIFGSVLSMFGATIALVPLHHLARRAKRKQREEEKRLVMARVAKLNERS